MTPAPKTPHEIVVFFPLDRPVSGEDVPPTLQSARELVAFLRVGRAEVGVDALTLGCELRLYYDPLVLAKTKQWLQNQTSRTTFRSCKIYFATKQGETGAGGEKAT